MEEASNAEPAARRSRTIGVVYLLYFLTTVGGTLLAGAHPGAGEAAELASTGLYAAVVVLLYFLFARDSRPLSFLAMLFGLAGCTITAATQLHLAVRMDPLGFFAPYCLLIGVLITRSRVVPRILGLLLILAGFAWGVALLHPPAAVATVIDVVGFVAEFAFMLWLLIAGVEFGIRRDSA